MSSSNLEKTAIKLSSDSERYQVDIKVVLELGGETKGYRQQ